MSTPGRRLYVQRVLDLYRRAPGTTGRLLRSDRRLAAELHDRGVPLGIVCAALILAVARRTFRSGNAPPLAPIASLHNIRPVIDELRAQPPDPGYIDYIRYKLAAVAPGFVTPADPQLS
jgi:hypothetical protein